MSRPAATGDGGPEPEGAALGPYLGPLAASVALGFLVLFAVGWLLPVVYGDGVPAAERSLIVWFTGWSFTGVDLVLRETSHLTEGIVLASTITVAALLLWRRNRAHAGLLVFSYLAASLIHWSGKLLFARPRPRMTDWPDFLASGSAYPSGHALSGAAVYITLAYVLVRGGAASRATSRSPVRAGLGRGVIWAAAVAIVVLSGVGRLYVGLHWPSDVLAGWTCGLIVAAGCVVADQRAQASVEPVVSRAGDAADRRQRESARERSRAALRVRA